MHWFNRLPVFVVALLSGLLSVQLACGLGASAPAPTPAPTSSAASAPTPTESISVPASPAIPETRLLTLEFPPSIRYGDSDLVRLTLAMDTQGNLTPTAVTKGNSTQGQILNVPNLYDTHTVLAEARLDMAGVDVRPPGQIGEPLLPGQTVTFFWSVAPRDVGTYRGTVWFYLHFYPKTGGQDTRQALSAQPIEIESTSLFGLQATPARWLGVVGTFISSLLGLPFLDELLKRIWKRIRH